MYADDFAKTIELHIVSCTCLLLFGLIGSILNSLAFIKAIKVRMLINSRISHFLIFINLIPKTNGIHILQLFLGF